MVIRTVKSGMLPSGVVVSRDGSLVYTANSGSSDVTVIDTSDYEVKATVPAGPLASGADLTPDGKFLYVANSGDDTVTVIDTEKNKVETSIKVGESPLAFGKFITQGSPPPPTPAASPGMPAATPAGE
jgi:YVTN family beta-propeller protein